MQIFFSKKNLLDTNKSNTELKTPLENQCCTPFLINKVYQTSIIILGIYLFATVLKYVIGEIDEC